MKTHKQEKKYFCPQHKAELVLREAKHGINRGTKFWGCPTWSKTACDYTLPYETNKRKELSLKEKFLNRIKNKKGKISLLKIIGQILLIPVYILGFMLTFNDNVFREIKRKN